MNNIDFEENVAGGATGAASFSPENTIMVNKKPRNHQGEKGFLDLIEKLQIMEDIIDQALTQLK
jgi:hypothetical protein